MSLNSVSLGNANYSSANVSFKQDSQKSKPYFQTIQSTKIEEKNKKSFEKGVITTILAIAGAIGLGVVAGVKSPKNMKKVIMNFDDFKAAGNKLVKGKAITKKGKPFTGKVAHTRKNGEIVLVEYKDGWITRSTSPKWVKTYTHENGKSVLTSKTPFVLPTVIV